MAEPSRVPGPQISAAVSKVVAAKGCSTNPELVGMCNVRACSGKKEVGVLFQSIAMRNCGLVNCKGRNPKKTL